MKDKRYKLPAEFREKWLEALRSGKYTQGYGKLHEDGRYCCLGVAAKILGISEDTMESLGLLGDVAELTDVEIPNVLCTNSHEISNENELANKLINLNDGYNSKKDKVESKSFQEIADYIEEVTVGV